MTRAAPYPFLRVSAAPRESILFTRSRGDAEISESRAAAEME